MTDQYWNSPDSFMGFSQFQRRFPETTNALLAQRAEREQKFNQENPDGFSRLSDEIDALKQYGLYCGHCGHGNGCRHDVPPTDH